MNLSFKNISFQYPNWLSTIVNSDGYCNVRSKDKRTYLATKTMPDGQGALGYIAVSLADGEPQWIQKKNGQQWIPKEGG